MAETNYNKFEALDIRVGTILSAERSNAKKPTYRMQVDLGSEIGIKVSVGGFTAGYQANELVGKKVICICNLGTIKMGPELSEVLVLGADDSEQKTRPLTIDSVVPNGTKVY